MKKNVLLLFIFAYFTLIANAAQPTLKTFLTEDYPIEMASLKPYPIYINADVDVPDTINQVTLTIDAHPLR